MHVARMSIDFLNEHGVDFLDWPPYSPDMNPIEHIWDILGRRIRRRPAPPDNGMRVYTLSDRRSEKKLCVYTASEAKGLTLIMSVVKKLF